MTDSPIWKYSRDNSTLDHSLIPSPSSPNHQKQSVNIQIKVGSTIPKSDTIKQRNNCNLPIEFLQENSKKAKILFSLHQHGYLTSDHIFKMHWPQGTTKRACQIALMKMCGDGFIRKILQPTTEIEGRKPFVYHLDKRGAEYISACLGIPLKNIPYYPKSKEGYNRLFAHSFECADIRIAFELAAQNTGVEILSLSTDTQIKKGTERDRIKCVLPDGKIRYRTIIQDTVIKARWRGLVTLFFFEHDRVTEDLDPSLEDLDSWRDKFLSYMAYFESQEFVERYGNLACRVLVTCRSARRLENIMGAIAKIKTRDELVHGHEKDRSMFWFNHFKHASNPKQILTFPSWTHICKFEQREEIGWKNQKVKIEVPLLSPGISLLQECEMCLNS